MRPVVTLRVKALQPQRRRAGMLFTREARELSLADLGDGLGAGEALLALVSDPQLKVTGIDAEGEEHPVTAEMVEELAALVDADRQARQAELDALLEQAAIDAANAPQAEPDTTGPQDGGSAPAVEALQATGPDAGANDSTGSAAGAVTPAQATEPDPKPERPAAAKKPADRTKGKSTGAGD